MSPAVRTGAALLAGVVIASLTLAAIETTAHARLSDHRLFAAAAAALGVGALLGGMAAIWIGRRRWLAWAVAGILTALSLMNIMSFPHPNWFIPAAALALAVGAWLASLTGRTRPRPA